VHFGAVFLKKRQEPRMAVVLSSSPHNIIYLFQQHTDLTSCLLVVWDGSLTVDVTLCTTQQNKTESFISFLSHFQLLAFLIIIIIIILSQ
jgi:hypothetical protein